MPRPKVDEHKRLTEHRQVLLTPSEAVELDTAVTASRYPSPSAWLRELILAELSRLRRAASGR